MGLTKSSRQSKAGDRRRGRSRGAEALEPRRLLAAAPLADINLAPADSLPYRPAASGGQLFFATTDGSTYNELWATDGTEAGTVRLKALPVHPSQQGFTNRPYLQELTDVAGTLFFTAPDPTGGRELWKSDGTEAGTVRVKDLDPGTFGSNPAHLTAVGGTLYFTASLPGGGRGVYRSDGTEAGTYVIHGATPGFESVGPTDLVNVDGTLFFAAAHGPSGGRELYKSDGTPQGTALVKDISPRFASNPQRLTAVGGTLFFSADGTEDNRINRELWKSDGTAEGTVLVRDLYPGSDGSRPAQLTAVGGALLFNATGPGGVVGLYRSDGTSDGTVLLKGDGTILPPADSRAKVAGAGAGDTLYFYESRSLGGGQFASNLWKTDGTADGTTLVTSVPGGAAGLTGVGDRLFFRGGGGASSATGRELWTSDGTAEGTRLVRDVRPGPVGALAAPTSKINLLPSEMPMAGMNGRVYFAADDGAHGNELWSSDGTGAGTDLVHDASPGTKGSSPARLTRAGGAVYFRADDGVHGTELWRTDGTADGTRLAGDVLAGSAGSVARNLFDAGDGGLYFEAYDGTGWALWKTDGTDAAPVRLRTVKVGSGGIESPSFMASAGGTFYFAGDDGTANDVELWKSDGTPGGTVRVRDINPGTGAASGPAGLAALNGRVLFQARVGASDVELWASDGTEAGTARVRDIRPGEVGSFPQSLTAVGDPGGGDGGAMVFAADDGAAGYELWRTDGTEQGTALLKDIYAGGAAANPGSFTRFGGGGAVFFTARTEAAGVELWRTDGTADGTVLLKDLVPGPASANPQSLRVVGDVLYFIAQEPAEAGGGYALWRSDGTPDGTVPVRGSLPRPANGRRPGNLIGLIGLIGVGADAGGGGGGVLFFHAPNAAGDDFDLWRSDGTAAGTVRVQSVGASPGAMAVLNGSLLFQAADPARGAELWKLSPPAASAGGPYAVPAGGAVTLDATASRDPDPAEALTFAWDLDGDGAFGETGPDAARGEETGPTPTFSAAGLSGPASLAVRLRVTSGTGLSAAAEAAVHVEAPPAAVVGRHVFYNNSAFDGYDPAAGDRDDAAIAADKVALLPGRTATFANYTSYSRGINGVMVDVSNPGDVASLSAEDFEFRAGNDDDPAAWAAAPLPSIAVRPTAGGTGAATRVTLTWPDGAIRKTWLRVTVKANERTGLASPDVFYFGNAPGESGNWATAALVNSVDEAAARHRFRPATNPAPVTFRWDYNRDGRVNWSDVYVVRANRTAAAALRLITPVEPLTAGRSPSVAAVRPTSPAPAGKAVGLFPAAPLRRPIDETEGAVGAAPGGAG